MGTKLGSLSGGRLLQWAVIGTVLTACSNSETRDSKKVKAAQIASLGDAPNEIAGQSLKDFFWYRSAWIVPKKNLANPITGPGGEIVLSYDPINGGARAAPLTSDGYYLTAAHVLDESGAALVGPKLLPYQGRTVKTFPAADLAVIKFAVQPPQHFEKWQSAPARGDAVFSAAPQGVEPFEVRGSVKTANAWGERGEFVSVRCELPAMHGNSGTPVANAKGELIGVIASKRRTLMPGQIPPTHVEMLEASVLKAIIEEDRKAHAR